MGVEFVDPPTERHDFTRAPRWQHVTPGGTHTVGTQTLLDHTFKTNDKWMWAGIGYVAFAAVFFNVLVNLALAYLSSALYKSATRAHSRLTRLVSFSCIAVLPSVHRSAVRKKGAAMAHLSRSYASSVSPMSYCAS